MNKFVKMLFQQVPATKEENMLLYGACAFLLTVMLAHFVTVMALVA
jgi:hypothetical protein